MGNCVIKYEISGIVSGKIRKNPQFATYIK